MEPYSTTQHVKILFLSTINCLTQHKCRHMSDEAHFHLNGYANKQNCRLWDSENPRATHQYQLHPSKCTVWCGVMATRAIVPYFFENEDEPSESISGAS